MAQKTRHEQQIVPKNSPIGQGFLGQGWFAKRFVKKRAKRRSGPKVMWAKSGAGQKWSEKPNTWKKQFSKKKKKTFGILVNQKSILYPQKKNILYPEKTILYHPNVAPNRNNHINRWNQRLRSDIRKGDVGGSEKS